VPPLEARFAVCESGPFLFPLLRFLYKLTNGRCNSFRHGRFGKRMSMDVDPSDYSSCGRNTLLISNQSSQPISIFPPCVFILTSLSLCSASRIFRRLFTTRPRRLCVFSAFCSLLFPPRSIFAHKFAKKRYCLPFLSHAGLGNELHLVRHAPVPPCPFVARTSFILPVHRAGRPLGPCRMGR